LKDIRGGRIGAVCDNRAADQVDNEDHLACVRLRQRTQLDRKRLMWRLRWWRGNDSGLGDSKFGVAAMDFN
jgi:hypothetical protein